jgi:thioredoxin reductase
MDIETIIVGAGAAGLQMGYFLQKEGRPYCILERAPAAASFYEQFPHSGKLLSINKVNTGVESYDTNLRYDWHSLLNDEQFSFKTYSREYYPAKEDFVQYMNDFAKRFKLRIQYNHTVKTISKESDGTYRLEVDVSGGSSGGSSTVTATCKKLILATGLSKPNLPKWLDQTKVRPKHYAEYPKDFFRKRESLEQFRNKSVLIVGNGNAGYELAKLLAPWASHTRIYGRRSKPWAAATHYPGDLRANYLSIVDDCSFSNLQAIDTTLEGTLCLEQLDAKEPYTAYTICSSTCHTKHMLASKHTFDRVIFATGWTFDTSPFQFTVPTLHDGMFPLVNSEFEVVGHPNLFCIGKLMHGFDYKESAGGFLHGYRHLIEYMASVQYKKKLSITIFKQGHEKVNEVANQIMVKLNMTSALFNLHGYMSDIFYYDATKQDYVYFHNIPMNCLRKIIQAAPNTVVFQLTLQYGHPHKETLDELGKVNQTSKEPALANLLHPVVRVFRARKRGLTEKGEGPIIEMVETIHFAEALYAEFTQRDEIFNKFIRLLKGYLP